MTASPSCPPVRALRQFAHAPAGDDRAESLRRHLGQCSRCREILTAFEAEDSAPSGDPAASPPADLVGTVRNAPPPPLPPTIACPAPTSPPLVKVTADSTEQLIGLLPPAQEEDALGRLGPYRLLRVLGSGATGVVFLAEDVQLGRPAALKVMKPVSDDSDLARQRFLREARAAALLDHDHVVPIYQIGEDRGLPFLAMKLLQGETLGDRLEREGQLLIHEVLRIGREVALGLAAAHDKGLVHRDVKPANIFLEGPDARVKLVDFGLARGGEDAQLTRTGTVLGTPAYMSPEQARGARADHRSDLFSLGGVLYRMCAGRTPFKADDTMGMLLALTHDDPPPVRALNSDVPEPLAGLIARLLAKRPEGRPQSAAAVADLLEAIEAQGAAARTAGQVGLPSGEKPAAPAWVFALQLALLAGLGWGLFWYGPAVMRAAQVWGSKWFAEVTRASDRP